MKDFLIATEIYQELFKKVSGTFEGPSSLFCGGATYFSLTFSPSTRQMTHSPKVTQYKQEVAPSAPKGEAENLIKKPMNPANLTMNPANLSGFLKLQVLPNCFDLNFPPKTAQIGWIHLKFGHFFGFTYFSVG